MSTKFLSRKPVWLNCKTGSIFYTKPSKTILKYCKYFPSTAEYKLYCELIRTIPHYIEVKTQKHLTVGGVRWRIDFLLESQYNIAYIANEFNCNIYNHTKPLYKVFIEYKGFKDKNFIRKQRNLHRYPSLDSTLLVVSGKNDIIYDKVIYSVEYFIEQLSLSWANKKNK